MFRKKAPAPVLPPEWLVVGLGNPGPEYRHTRHNVGFDLVDALAAAHGGRVQSAKHRSLTGQVMVEGVPVLLIKPLTFMNLSGQSVAPQARALGIKPDRILVVADDLDLPVGKLRLRDSGSAGGHNGHRSLIQSLGTQEYPRLKIGIGSNRSDTVSHVLDKFHPEERVTIEASLKAAIATIEALLRGGYPSAQHVIEKFNASL